MTMRKEQHEGDRMYFAIIKKINKWNKIISNVQYVVR